MVGRLPHHVFAGNRLDSRTRPGSVQDLKTSDSSWSEWYSWRRGMMTIGTVKQLARETAGVLAGTATPQSQGHFRLYPTGRDGAVTGNCVRGESRRGKRRVAADPRVMEVAGERARVRVLVVHSEERELYEGSLRELAMGRVRKELESLDAPGRQGGVDRTGQDRSRGGPQTVPPPWPSLFRLELQHGKFRFFEHPLHLTREKAFGGQVRNPDRRTKSFRPGGSRPLQRAQRSRAGLRALEGLAGVASDLSPQR